MSSYYGQGTYGSGTYGVGGGGSAGTYGSGHYGLGVYGYGESLLAAVNSDLSPVYNVKTHATGSLTAIYNVLTGTLHNVRADLIPNYNIKERKTVDLIITYNIGLVPAPASSSSSLIEEVVLPTDLSSYAERLHGYIDPVVGGER